jgi:hypothetical protein
VLLARVARRFMAKNIRNKGRPASAAVGPALSERLASLALSDCRPRFLSATDRQIVLRFQIVVDRDDLVLLSSMGALSRFADR